jgi:hypothetical protein
MKLIKKAIKEYYGKRCPDFEPECIVCQAWAEYDSAKRRQRRDYLFDPNKTTEFVAPRSLEIAEALRLKLKLLRREV